MGDKNLLSRVPPCFGRHVKLLVLAALAVISLHSSVKEGLRQADLLFPGVPAPLNGIRVGKIRKTIVRIHIASLL
jgi:hypothetical protein